MSTKKSTKKRTSSEVVALKVAELGPLTGDLGFAYRDDINRHWKSSKLPSLDDYDRRSPHWERGAEDYSTLPSPVKYRDPLLKKKRAAT